MHVTGTGAIFVVLLLLWGGLGYAWAASNIAGNSPNYYAWSENVGWLNSRPLSGADGVMVDAGCLRGYVWAENIGYINLGAPAATSCDDYLNTAADNYGVVVDGSGNCSGYGWSESVGWINFNPTCDGSCSGTGVTIVSVDRLRDEKLGIFMIRRWEEAVEEFDHRRQLPPNLKIQTVILFCLPSTILSSIPMQDGRSSQPCLQ